MDLWQKTDSEELYRTVCDLEGTRHFYAHQDELDRAADYIVARMKGYGLVVREQTFTIGDHPTVFRNIEGSIGPVDGSPAAVLTAHYDTVATTPGANDDAGGIAVMLEVARILAAMDDPPPVYFLAATQEENSNPLIFTPQHESALRHHVWDESFTFTSWAMTEGYRTIHRAAMTGHFHGGTIADGFRNALQEARTSLPDGLCAHIEEIVPLYEGINVVGAIGTLNRMGSTRWVAEAVAKKREIAFCLALDELGVFRDEPYTQGELDPATPIFESLTDQHLTDPRNRRGNFLFVLTDTASEGTARSLLATCRNVVADLPFGWLSLPLDFDGIVHNLPRALAADHAPFWQAGIPAVFLFDTSSARDPFVHTPGDTVDKLDFDRLRLVTGTIVAALVDRGIYRGDARRVVS